MTNRLTKGDPATITATRHHLGTRPMRCGELAEAMNVSLSTAMRYINFLRDQGEVRVAGWTPNKNPIYALGSEPDEPRPPKQPKGEGSRKYWEKLKADPEKHKKRLKQHAAYIKRKRKTDPIWRLEEAVRKKKDYYKKRTTVPVDPFAAQFAGLFKRS